MKYVLFVLALVAVPACASTHLTPETPKAAAAITADEIVLRINEFQATIIDACGQHPTCAGIEMPLAQTLVQTCIDVRAVLRNVPDGWPMTLKSTWLVAKGKFVNVTNPAVLAAFRFVDLAIAGLL